LQQFNEQKGSCAHSETSDSKMCWPTNTASCWLHRSPRTILKGSIMKYMIILLRHNIYDRLWWPHKTDKVGVKDWKLTKYETKSKIHWFNIYNFSIPW
jgi:hypothetical protein